MDFLPIPAPFHSEIWNIFLGVKELRSKGRTALWHSCLPADSSAQQVFTLYIDIWKKSPCKEKEIRG